MKETRCKGCGRAMIFAQDEKGKIIPLDPSAPVYRVTERERIVDGKLAGIETVCKRDSHAMVTHFSTCSKANQFSGSKKRVRKPLDIR